ncbi:nucleoside-diphosphate kinase [Nocardia aurantiaca]|uniref:Nucleoside-diphosphate kinase n=1 Tax=Nocardia aurantiaca TaxID=2675850 RepID=A0A6I3L1U3_9NOCA|nr:nucleoside-diphosphate kinase [Nocardia aurantiaca]MTE14556.1 nucleoside-diphosphate kinase [Nocardia aurantiaca]
MTDGTLRTLLDASTPDKAKVDAYLTDTYVLETVEQAERLGIDPGAFAREHSLLLLKPDAIVARAVEPTLMWLADNDFQVVDARRVVVDRHVARALWYFAWNIASPERRRLADLLVGISDVLVLVVRGPVDDLPTPVRLTAAKGATDPRKRQPGELRYLLGRHNYLLNLVHSPDDPADVLRELAIYFDEATRAQVLARALEVRDRTDTAAALARDLYDDAPARSFERDDAVARLCAELDSEAMKSLDRRMSTAEPGSDAAQAALLDVAWATGRELDPWSLIVLGSHLLPMRTGTGSQTLRPVSATDWLEARP